MASGVCFGFRRSSLFVSTIAILLLAFFGVCRVEATATLKLYMIRFSNPREKDYGGSCCDLFCNDCDHRFRFSLDRGNSDNNAKGSYYWSKTTGEYEGQNTVTFGSNMKGVSNPIVTTFNPRWPSVGVKLKVWVTDEDGRWSGDDDVDGFVHLLRLTPARSSSTASWTSITIYGLRPRYKTTLRLKYMLYCDANYYSSDCSVYCVARDSDTHGHYTCDPATGNIVCRAGWEDVSRMCKTRSNDCLGHRCRNGATCVDGVRSYTCRCPPGYTGRYCEVNINECAPRPCLNGGTCTDQVASYRCTCRPEFVGRTCATPYCRTNNPCLNGGTCYGTGLCRCPPGFVGAHCAIDLCQLVTCHNNGSCVNGSCVCPVGIAGSTCDVIKCDLISCLNGGSCKHGVCTCPTGFTGEICETNIDECASNPCENNGTCYDLVNGYSCACPPEYTGRTCSTPYCNVIANNRCRNGATCYGAGQCLCRTGFVGDDCSVDLCDLLDCQNGGSCVNESCVCPPGVTGARCDLELCSLMTCWNGGTCSEGTCACPSGFTGRLCEIDIDDCVGDPCEHDGTCDDHANGFTCRCLPGYAGKLCSETVSHANNVTKTTSIIYANSSSSNSTYIMYESTDDQPGGQMDAVDVWFFTSLVIIFVLLVIIIILTICLCCKQRNGTMTLERDKPPEQPAPEPVVAAAAADRAVENDYYSIKKHSATTTTVSVKLDGNDDDDEDVDDPLYESISGAAGSVRSDTSPDVSPEPYDKLHVPDLCESSDL